MAPLTAPAAASAAHSDAERSDRMGTGFCAAVADARQTSAPARDRTSVCGVLASVSRAAIPMFVASCAFAGLSRVHWSGRSVPHAAVASTRTVLLADRRAAIDRSVRRWRACAPQARGQRRVAGRRGLAFLICLDNRSSDSVLRGPLCNGAPP
jgi:hypothetical protein